MLFLYNVLQWFVLICKPVAPLITTLQTSQMAMFTVVNCSAVFYLYFEEPRLPCSVIPLILYSNAAVRFLLTFWPLCLLRGMWQ